MEYRYIKKPGDKKKKKKEQMKIHILCKNLTKLLL